MEAEGVDVVRIGGGPACGEWICQAEQVDVVRLAGRSACSCAFHRSPSVVITAVIFVSVLGVAVVVRVLGKVCLAVSMCKAWSSAHKEKLLSFISITS
jgi:hypothetical protein